MKTSFHIPVVTLIIVLFLSCVSAEAGRRARTGTPEKQPKIAVASLEKKVHSRINDERRKHGLQPLAWDETLAEIARKHSQDMAKRSYFSHNSPEGHDFSHRYRAGNYSCGVKVGQIIYTGAENIYQNNLYDSVTVMNGKESFDWNSEDKIARTTVDGWMKSTGHRKNILTPHWGKEGIGVSISSDGKVYITQNFC